MLSLNFSLFRYCCGAIILAIAISGCAYKSQIRQGNPDLPEQISQLKIGMTKEEILSRLDKTFIYANFNSENEWTYYYKIREEGFYPNTQSWGITLIFKDNTLTQIIPLEPRT